MLVLIQDLVNNMKELELIFIKPDAMKRKLAGKIIDRFEQQEGFVIKRMQMGRITQEIANVLYEDTPAQIEGMGKKTYESMAKMGVAGKIESMFGTENYAEIGKQLNAFNRKYATSTEVIALILEGENAVTRSRQLIGKTDPALADKGTIRGDWGVDSITKANMEMRACENLVHASDTDTAARDVAIFEKLFFAKK